MSNLNIQINNLNSYKIYTIGYSILQVLFFALLIGFSAQIKIQLPFTPVPITLQTFFVILSGAYLGFSKGVFSNIMYISAGLSGFPIFAGFGSGIIHLLGPTGGYIFGFIFASGVAGILKNKGWTKNFTMSLLLMIFSSIVIYFIGILWLGFYLGFDKIIQVGVIPFLPGDILKIIIGSFILSNKKFSKINLLFVKSNFPF